jgi:PKD repeat protein
VGTVVTFTVTASIPGNPANDFIQSIRLDFGDGQSADLGATAPGGVLHSYAAAGTYAPSATATDTNGSVARASLTIVVK